jgi:Fur family peroxide stress response transcriptional regulator
LEVIEMSKQLDRAQYMIQVLREAGNRITPQRTAIAQVLSRSTTHPSVEDIYEELYPRFPSMSLATVYKTVALFCELGLVLDLGTLGDERRYDGRMTEPHLHLLCERCGAIEDCNGTSIEVEQIHKSAREIGFEVRAVRYEVIGLCRACQELMAVESEAVRETVN